MKKKYAVRQIGADYQRLSQKLGVDPITVRLMVNRGVEECDMKNYLSPSREMLQDPYLLRDAKESANLIENLINEGKKIRVIGDYDIDGIMSTYILVSCLRNLGADVDYSIPHRVRDGYGLNVKLVDETIEAGRDAIITCDNGIAAYDAIEHAKNAGLTVIVTDHHIVPFKEEDGTKLEILPPADYIVNPHRVGDEYPFKEICGAVVAWKLMLVLYKEMGADSDFVWDRMENAGFATVGDVMPLVKENRALVKMTLLALRKTKNIGMQELMEASSTNPDNLSSFSIGFVLGPMMNASGRLSDACLGVELLLSEDRNKAKDLAERLYHLNQERKHQTEIGTEAAIEKAKEYEDDKVLVIFLPDVNESVAGIIAGRVREATGKPSFVLVRGAESAKGSGRSIEAFSMYEEMHKCEHLLLKYGGHPMAAGLSLEEENIDEFRRLLNENTTLTEDDLVEKVYLDAQMNLSYITEKLVHEINRLEPYGNKNEKPIFGATNIPVVSVKQIGSEGQYLRFVLRLENGGTITALSFRNCEEQKATIIEKYGESAWEDLLKGRAGSDVRLTFTFFPNLNDYNGRVSVQIMIQDIL